MAFTEDLGALFVEFGVAVEHAGIATTGILDQPGASHDLGPMVAGVDYTVLFRTATLPSAREGDSITVDGKRYTIKGLDALDDGALTRAGLKVA